MRERKHLGRVRERDGSFAGGIEGVEQEDEECDHAKVRPAAGWYIETHASGQERPKHLGEGEDEQAAASEGVNRPDGRPGEDEVDEAEAPCCKKGGDVTGTCLLEDGGRVEGNNVDYSQRKRLDLVHQRHQNITKRLPTTTHLLGDHDNA